MAGALLTVPVVLMTGGAASAADAGMTGQIVSWVPQADGHATAVFQLQNPTPGAVIDPNSVKVTIDGQTVPSPAKPIGEVSTVRATVLTMDVSGSMADNLPGGTTKIAAAKQAAASYLASVPKDVLVGLVTFADKVNIVQKPTVDHAAVAKAVAALAPNGGTHLYDAVIVANSVITSADVRSQLVLSDGKDATSRASLAAAEASVVNSKTNLNAVALGATDAVQRSSLNALAAAGHGQVQSTVDAADLTKIFAQQADATASQVVVDVVVPPAFRATTKNVVVSANAGGQTVSATGDYIMPAASATATSDPFASASPIPVATSTPGITSKSWFLPVALGALALGLFALLAVAFMSSDRENQTSGRVRRRLSRYSLSSRPDEKATTVATSGALGQSQVARSAVELAGRVVQSRDLDTGLGARLEAAGLPLKSPEWMIIHLGIAIVAGLVLALLTGFSILPTLLGLVLGLILPFLYLSLKESRRKAAFAAALPETLQLLSGSLAAGYSLPQAVDTVVRESSGPMAVELNKAIVEARLGVPIEDALDTVARRMDSVDFEWVVMAIRIQREVGGNLAEVLTNVAATMRERERLRRQVDVLSAEGRLSAIILGALPLLFVTYLILVRPEYIGLLVTNPLGIVMIVVGVILLIAGAFWLRKVVTVEV